MTCADCHAEGADCLTADRVRVCSDCLYERVVKERDEARAEVEREKASATRGWQMADSLHLSVKEQRERAEKAERERDEARAEVGRLGTALTQETRLSLHTQRQLDEARAEVERLRSLKPIGTNSTATTIENVRRAKAAGASGAIVVTPYYNKPQQEGLYRHFEAVAKDGDLPVPGDEE